MPGRRILVIDDDRIVRETVGQFLEHEGYEVECSPHGADALEKVSSRPPDVILLDLMMPGMNGRQFMDALRDNLGLTEIPILVMTAIHGITTSQAFALGASDVVEKPFDIDVMLNKVALALFRARSGVVESAPPVERTGDYDVPRAGGVVLLVDPDRATWRHLDSVLGNHGFQMVSMPRITDDLLRLARVLEPKAILLELGSPGGDGLSALRRLRQEPMLDDTPLLLVSPDRHALDAVRAEASALDIAILPKPFADEALIAAVTTGPRAAGKRAIIY